MGNFEKLGILVIIMLVVVILVLTVWGVGQPVDELGAAIIPQQLQLRGANGGGGKTQDNPHSGQRANDVPLADPLARGNSSWPDDDVPEEPPQPDHPTPPVPDRIADLTHTLKKGESFYGLALHYYRDGTKFLVIQEANPTLDPQLLSVGTKVIIPHPDLVLEDAPRLVPAPRSTPASRDTYVVKKGDSLWRIAKRTLGRGSDFPKILDANRALLGEDGDDLDVGMTLLIPR